MSRASIGHEVLVTGGISGGEMGVISLKPGGYNGGMSCGVEVWQGSEHDSATASLSVGGQALSSYSLQGMEVPPISRWSPLWECSGLWFLAPPKGTLLHDYLSPDMAPDITVMLTVTPYWVVKSVRMSALLLFYTVT